MLYIRKVLPRTAVSTRSITLAFESRRKSRLRTALDDGAEAALLLDRGTVLREGDKLGADDGSVVEVRAAGQLVSTVTTDDPLLLARAAYHLGNRHVPLQIELGRLRFEHDHVLDDLVRSLGLDVSVEQAPFEPEAGSYAGGHRHGHDHSHSHHDHDDHDHHDHDHHDHDHRERDAQS
jgi:urease accessory protein